MKLMLDGVGCEWIAAPVTCCSAKKLVWLALVCGRTMDNRIQRRLLWEPNLMCVNALKSVLAVGVVHKNMQDLQAKPTALL